MKKLLIMIPVFAFMLSAASTTLAAGPKNGKGPRPSEPPISSCEEFTNPETGEVFLVCPI